MKKMMMALAALCVAGAASAVTIDWGNALTAQSIQTSDGQEVSTRYDFTTGITTDGAYGTPTCGAIKVVATFNASSIGAGTWPGYLFMVGEKWEDGKTQRGFGYYLSKGGTTLINEAVNVNGDNAGGSGTWSNTKPTTLVSGQTYEFIIAIERDGSDLGADIYMNGEKIAEYSVTTSGYWFQSVAVGSKLNGTDELTQDTGVWLTDTEVYFAADISRADVAAALPEPTALALLALGVAGLALRRRAA